MPICQFCDENIPAGVTKCPSCGAEVPAEVHRQEPNDLEGELLAFINRGKTIDAIKRYRDVTGAGLAEAKRYVDNLIETRWSPTRDRPKPRSSDGDIEQAVLDLMKEKRKIEAIRIYREGTGVGLKEAKEAVESLAAKHGVAATGTGCFAVLVMVASAAALSSYFYVSSLFVS